jgi:hypothetical protein
MESLLDYLSETAGSRILMFLAYSVLFAYSIFLTDAFNEAQLVVNIES